MHSGDKCRGERRGAVLGAPMCNATAETGSHHAAIGKVVSRDHHDDTRTYEEATNTVPTKGIVWG